ncbi:Uncharacterised protein [Mycobacteroides abscessus subsp. abscessus]|nr:Uncharacterised protein [Mycobacteroides abscessus subsp. abscessus]SKU77217.1 Uncharacterised protein [Mycobacteroides abscessus subsp. abscessus]
MDRDLDVSDDSIKGVPACWEPVGPERGAGNGLRTANALPATVKSAVLNRSGVELTAETPPKDHRARGLSEALEKMRNEERY